MLDSNSSLAIDPTFAMAVLVAKSILTHQFDVDWPAWHHEKELDFEYTTFGAPGIIVTGVRPARLIHDTVVLTASYIDDGVTSAALYRGTIDGLETADASDWNVLTPVFEGQTVTSSTFYGPNTFLFDHGLGVGNVRAVGSYKYAEDTAAPNSDHGMIYEGPIDGVGGTWTQIDATALVAQGDTLLNTIAHSTMGDIVVGNYDTGLLTGNAFIHDVETGEWIDLNPGDSLSVTAYGIWQNGGSHSHFYTIAGGFSDLNTGGLDAGYLVDYNAKTDTFSNYTTFQFDNMPLDASISHFDGITRVKGGYNLTGDYILEDGTEGAFFAHIPRNRDGTFGEAEWTAIDYPGEDVTATSGNTVVGDTVFGIYVSDGEPSSFFATASHGWDLWG
ncbi:hypothetical protein [Acuticoccus kandeliae]|uniref:hypothetical protein n=1 Tax=Acuticoccus kandeliae TaxID=2073160 RepID=UPI000D3E17D5|nr:hypothetical protein [Acuticoccus kandeliae]